MKRPEIVIAMLIVALGACSGDAPAGGKRDLPFREFDMGPGVLNLKRWGPDEFGVVCYGNYGSSAALSCVKVEKQ